MKHNIFTLVVLAFLGMTIAPANGLAYYANVTTLAGSGSATFTDGIGTDASFNQPHGVAIDSASGNLFVADTYNHRIRKILSNGTVTTFAGSGLTTPFTNDIGTAASFKHPHGVAIDSATGNLFVADYSNNLIRKILSNGTVTTFAGNGLATPFTNGIGTAASFYGARGVAIDSATGNLFVADYDNHLIRKILSNGTVTTFAGSVRISSPSTNGIGTAAKFARPAGVAIDSATGNLFVADYSNHRIRKILRDGTVSTFAGSGNPSFANGIGIAASFHFPHGVAIDSASGNLFVADASNNRIRIVLPNGMVTTVAGSGSATFTNGIGTAASFNYPMGVAIDSVSGNLFVADRDNHCIRKITLTLCIAGYYCPDNGNIIICPIGTYSPQTGAISCTPCAAGTWTGETGSLTCTNCLSGTYNAFTSSTSITACLLCSSGTSSNISAATSPSSCTLCPSGQFSAQGSSICTNCPPGSYSNSGASSCTPCPIGSYCPSGLIIPCPIGTYGSSVSLSSLSSCTNCSAGYYNPSTGASSAANCLTCNAGYYSGPGSSMCSFCPAGTSNPSTASISSTSCINCLAGTYASLPGQPSCASVCPIGFYGFKTKGVSATDACAPCPPGSFTNSPASTTCVPCAQGYYTSSNQSTSCDACPFHTYLSSSGGNALSNCTACPTGLKTSAPGSIAAFQCIYMAYVCDPLKQPKSSMLPLSADDCVPLTCPSHLTYTPAGCSGCPFGTSGFAPSSCNPCPPSTSCPGFLSQPLPANASLLMAPFSSITAPTAPICNSAILLPRVLVTLTPGPFSFVSIPPLAAIIVGASLSLIVLLFTIVPRMHATLKSIDSFATAHSLKEDEYFKNSPTPLGGACTVASVLAFLTAATIIIIGFATSNSVLTSTLDTATPQSSQFTDDIMWASLPSAVKLLPPFPTSASLQVRIFAPVGLDCATPQTSSSWTASDAGWVAGVISDCGDGRSLLTLTCTSCALSASSMLTITLPFTCQSLYVEAIAVDAIGEINVLKLPSTASSALGSQLLTSITWTLNPMASIFKDTIIGRTMRGLRLLASTATPTYAVANAALITPLAAAIVLTVHLPLQTTFSITTLTQQQTPAQLFATIIGLLGIMGAFRILFQIAEKSQGGVSGTGVCNFLTKRGQKSSLTNEPIVDVNLERDITVIDNPMGSGDGSSCGDNGEEWVKHVDAENGEVWFVNSVTRVSTWDPPPQGSTVVRHSGANMEGMVVGADG